MQIITFVFLSLFIWSSPAIAFDYSDWDALLKKHVKVRTESGVRFSAVNYPAMKKDANYSKLIAELAKFSPDSLKSKEEKLAFWINLYNVFAVKMVQDNFPVESIKDAGSFFNPVWDKEVGVVGGKKVTLSEIEHEILRKMGEPRIHVAIVCASVSCPDLRKEIYTAEKLDAQLDDQVKGFLENRGKGLSIERGDGKVLLSSIFKWFKEDFESEGGVLAFVSKYVSEKDAAYLKSKKLKISYINYDWNLNSL
jgi:hypothetical protein